MYVFICVLFITILLDSRYKLLYDNLERLIKSQKAGKRNEKDN